MMRDNNIDFLRSLGLLLVILAHIGAPNGIQQLRCFDVPLMVFVSGLASSGKSLTVSYSKYLINRTKRLIFPTWLFLCFYIGALFIAQKLGLIPPYITWNKLIESFLLLDGVGYVWIIRVFLLIMTITPLLIRLCINIKSLGKYIIVLICLFALQEGLCIILPKLQNFKALYFVINEYLVYLVGYSIIFLLGLKLRYYKNNSYVTAAIIITLASVLTIGAIIYINTNGLPIYINSYKYPPHSYFLLYGSCISVLLWLVRPLYSHLASSKIFVFLGSNSIWIYLWHIPFILVANKYIDSWIIRYAFVLISCIIMYYLQYYIVNRKALTKFTKYLIG